MKSKELNNIKSRYQKRKDTDSTHTYNPSDSHNLYFYQEKERVLVRMLNRHNIDYQSAKLIELGCGTGGNLLGFLRLKFLPENLSGNDLLDDRIETARHLLPEAIHLYSGDASVIDVETESYDIVYFSTVFSSILDSDLRHRVANRAWDLLKPGGAILWYDFTYDNPGNPDVKGVKFKEVKELFPKASFLEKKRITLAPPIARTLCKITPFAYTFFNILPFLRTHLLIWIQK